MTRVGRSCSRGRVDVHPHRGAPCVRVYEVMPHCHVTLAQLCLHRSACITGGNAPQRDCGNHCASNCEQCCQRHALQRRSAI